MLYSFLDDLVISFVFFRYCQKEGLLDIPMLPQTLLPRFDCKFYVVNNKPEYFHFFTLNNTVIILT